MASSKRLVVKIGSSILVDEAKGQIRRDWLEALTGDVARLHKGGCEVVLVSSGAIRLGRTYLKLAAGPLKLEESQAAAATGQIQLAHAYQEVAGAARHHRGAGPADARRFRGAPPLPQRAPDHGHPARPAAPCR